MFNKNFFKGMVFCVLVALMAASLFSQTATLIGDEYKNGDFKLQNGKAVRTNLYLPGDKSNRLFFTPFFVFKADKDNNLDVRIQPPLPGKTDWELKLTLLISPMDLFKNVADSLIDQLRKEGVELSELDKKYLLLQTNWLIPITFQTLKITCWDDPSLFEPVQFTSPSSQSQITLIARMPEENAKKISELLKTGTRTLEFNVEYSLNALFKNAESILRAESFDVYQTEAVKKLDGAGRAFKISGSGGVLSQNNNIITRSQTEAFKGELKRTIDVEYTLENPEDASRLDSILKTYLQEVFQSKDIELNDAFAADIAKISKYDFDPEDLSPDQLSRIAADVKNFFQSEEKEEYEVKASASVKYGVFGVSASGSVKRDTLKKLMTNNGWKFEGEGKTSYPKSLSVNVINKHNLQQRGTFNIAVKRVKRGYLVSQVATSTDYLYVQPDIVDIITEYNKLSQHVDFSAPVGTIISSMLSPEQMNPKGINNPLWVPADGKPLSPNSKYEALTGRKEAPDLRGLFLRGLNSFEIGVYREDMWADPENRSIGDLQSDSISSHAHSITPSSFVIAVPPFTNWPGGDVGRGGHYGGDTTPSSTISLSIGYNGGNESRPKNAAVYVYIKIN